MANHEDLTPICEALPCESGDISTQAANILKALTGEEAQFNLSVPGSDYRWHLSGISRAYGLTMELTSEKATYLLTMTAVPRLSFEGYRSFGDRYGAPDRLLAICNYAGDGSRFLVSALSEDRTYAALFWATWENSSLVIGAELAIGDQVYALNSALTLLATSGAYGYLINPSITVEGSLSFQAVDGPALWTQSNGPFIGQTILVSDSETKPNSAVAYRVDSKTYQAGSSEFTGSSTYDFVVEL